MTNSKSVDNYRFMTAEPFVMNNRTHCLIDGIQFVIYTIAQSTNCGNQVSASSSTEPLCSFATEPATNDSTPRHAHNNDAMSEYDTIQANLTLRQ